MIRILYHLFKAASGPPQSARRRVVVAAAKRMNLPLKHHLINSLSANNVMMADIWLRLGAPVTGNEEVGEDSPIFHAASMDTIDIMLAHGADINAKNFNGTPLIIHTNSKSRRIALLERGANPNATNENGRNVLFYCWDAELARILIGYGVNPLHSCNNGNTPLFFTPGTVAEVLIANGADPNHRNHYKTTPLMVTSRPDAADVLIAHGAEVNYKLGDQNPLKHAIKYSNWDVARTLVMAGAEVDGHDLSFPSVNAAYALFNAEKRVEDAMQSQRLPESRGRKRQPKI